MTGSMMHGDSEFSSPSPQPTQLLLEDRTLPFESGIRGNSIESNNDPPGNIQLQDISQFARYIHAIKWMVLLSIGYIINRVLAMFGVPNDAQHHTWLGHCRNMIDLFLMGFLQCWIVELIDSELRWRYLFRDAKFVIIYIISGPFFSILTTLPGFDLSLGEDVKLTPFFIAVLAITGIGLLLIIGWHVVHSKRILKTREDFFAFWWFRGLLLMLLFLSYLLIHSDLPTVDGSASLHLHHYFLAWLISTVAAFNHRICTLFLAVCTGIFVQGISVYSAATMFHRGDHDMICPEMRIH